MESATSGCKNCGHAISGRFCSNCGQRTNIQRITWHEIAHQFPHAIFHVDDGLLYTIKELASRPGHSIRDYFDGKRKPHYNPFLLLLMSAGLCSVLYTYFHIPTIFAGLRLDRVEEHSATLAHKFFAIRMAFFCLLCSFGDSLLFRRAGYSFPEMVIFNTFSFCGVSIIQLLFIPLFILGEYGGLAPFIRFFLLLVVLLYLWWVRMQFFEANKHGHYRGVIVVALFAYLVVIALMGQTIVQQLLRILFLE